MREMCAYLSQNALMVSQEQCVARSKNEQRIISSLKRLTLASPWMSSIRTVTFCQKSSKLWNAKLITSNWPVSKLMRMRRKQKRSLIRWKAKRHCLTFNSLLIGKFFAQFFKTRWSPMEWRHLFFLLTNNKNARTVFCRRNLLCFPHCWLKKNYWNIANWKQKLNKNTKLEKKKIINC